MNFDSRALSIINSAFYVINQVFSFSLFRHLPFIEPVETSSLVYCISVHEDDIRALFVSLSLSVLTLLGRLAGFLLASVCLLSVFAWH